MSVAPTMPEPPPRDMLRVALDLAAQGFRVFPLKKGDKRPAVLRWPECASFDPDKVRTMWKARDPHCNVGIATGRMRDGWLTVFDVDVKAHGRGRESVEALRAAHPGDWLDTKRVETPSGGDHLYFETDGPLANTCSKLGPNIDTRGEGGYVVAPGSTIDGRSYVDHGGPIRKAPDWMAAEIGAAADRVANGRVILCTLDTSQAILRATRFLETNADLAVEGSGGNSTTYAVAAGVKDFGLSEHVCCELLFTKWNDRCSPPWDLDALTEVVANAYQYEQNSIGCLSPEADFDAWTEVIPRSAPVAVVAPSRFRFEFFEHIASDLARRHLIKGVLLRNSTLGIIGAPGTGKSQLEAHLAYAIAAGIPWCGRAVEQGAVICALGEGAEGFRGRVQALRSVHGSKPIPFIVSPVSPNLLDVADVKEFVRATKELMTSIPETTLRMIIVDTLTAATPGGNQNETDVMSRVVSALRFISRELDCVAAIIHHVGKDATKGARGSSVFNGDLDTELTVEITGANRFRVVQTKQRDFEKGPAIHFVQRQAVIGKDADGDDVTAVYAEHDQSAIDDDFEPADMDDPADLADLLEKIRSGDWAKDSQSARWAGHAIADVWGLSLDAAGAKDRVKAKLAALIDDGILVVESVRDARAGREKPMIRAGRAAASTRGVRRSTRSKGGVEAEEGVDHTSHTTPAPIGAVVR